MCEFCDDPRVNWEETTRLPPGEGWDCDGDEEPCGRPATWRTVFGYVENHYCGEHRNESGEPALPEFSEPAPGYGGTYLLAIRTPEECEGPLVGPSCQRPANWSCITLAQVFACDRHRPEATPKEASRQVAAGSNPSEDST